VQVHASAAKAAIDSMTRSLALEWGHYGIRVNGVAPGPIRGTAGISKLAPGASEEAVAAEIAKTIPVGRMGEREDIALACAYLSSSAGSFVSGTTCPLYQQEYDFCLWRLQRACARPCVPLKLACSSRTCCSPSRTLDYTVIWCRARDGGGWGGLDVARAYPSSGSSVQGFAWGGVSKPQCWHRKQIVNV
jgi:Enoyl-(Acyl carrier protein) reductase